MICNDLPRDFFQNLYLKKKKSKALSIILKFNSDSAVTTERATQSTVRETSVINVTELSLLVPTNTEHSAFKGVELES